MELACASLLPLTQFWISLPRFCRVSKFGKTVLYKKNRKPSQTNVQNLLIVQDCPSEVFILVRNMPLKKRLIIPVVLVGKPAIKDR